MCNKRRLQERVSTYGYSGVFILALQDFGRTQAMAPSYGYFARPTRFWKLVRSLEFFKSSFPFSFFLHSARRNKLSIHF